MKLFTDEGLDFPIVNALRQKEFTVIYAAEDFIAGSDDFFLHTALENDRVLITKDKDFGKLVIGKKKASVRNSAN